MYRSHTEAGQMSDVEEIGDERIKKVSNSQWKSHLKLTKVTLLPTVSIMLIFVISMIGYHSHHKVPTTKPLGLLGKLCL